MSEVLARIAKGIALVISQRSRLSACNGAREGRTWAPALEGGLVDGQALAEAHVGHLGAPAVGQQDVLRLDVPVHNASLVQRHQALPRLIHQLRITEPSIFETHVSPETACPYVESLAPAVKLLQSHVLRSL